MISIIINNSNGSILLKKAIQKIFESKIKEKFELIIIIPDGKSEEILNEFKKNSKKVIHFKISKKGKSLTLNSLFKTLKGRIWIFTDANSYVGDNSINELLQFFEDKTVGCITGRPMSIDSRNNMIGFWSHLLFDAGAHKIRKELNDKGNFLECSGYLFAFRNNITKNIPLDVADDTIIPYLVTKKGYKVKYAEKAIVYVKNSTQLKNFIKQRIKAAEAHERLEDYAPFFPKVKSFRNEVKKGTFWALSYPKTIKEKIWTCFLFFIRLYIWGRVKWN